MSAANTSSLLKAQQVSQRTRLPHSIQRQLLPLARQDWSNYPSFRGSAAYFIAYHGNLLSTINSLVIQLEKIMQRSESEGVRLTQLQPVLRGGLDLVEKAHDHHQTEDVSYFPQFRRLLPTFAAAIDLLDGDTPCARRSAASF